MLILRETTLAFDPENIDHRAWLAKLALGRVTKLSEVAKTVAFLASPAASGITGAIIPVDAGFLCRYGGELD